MEIVATMFFAVPHGMELSGVADLVRRGLAEIEPLRRPELRAFDVTTKPLTRRIAIRLDLDLPQPDDAYVDELVQSALEAAAFTVQSGPVEPQSADRSVLYARGDELAIA